MNIRRTSKRSVSENDQRLEDLKKLVEQSYDSVRVVGRGTVKIDPKEVRNTKEFKEARKKARKIFNEYNIEHDQVGKTAETAA